MTDNLNLFFQYESDNFSQVWDVYQYILFEDAIALSSTTLDNEDFIYYGQSIWNQKTKKLKQEEIYLLESGKIYIETPPLIHPAFVKIISQILKISETELLEVSAYKASIIDEKIVKRNKYEEIINTGPYFVETLLEAKSDTVLVNNQAIKVSELLITRIPLLSSKKRRLLENFSGNSFLGIDNINYQLIWKISKELIQNKKYQDSFFANSYKYLQQYFEELIITIQYNHQNNRWDTLKKYKEYNALKGVEEQVNEIKEIEKPSQESLYVPLYRESWITRSNTIPIDCLYVNTLILCIQFSDRIVFYNFLDQKGVNIVYISCYKLKNVDFEKGYIQLYGCKDEDNHQITDFAHYNFKSKQWYSGAFEDFTYYELAHQLEKQRLVDYKNDVTFFMSELTRYPTKKIQSVCKQYVWINDKYGIGGLFDLKSGLCIVSRENVDEFLDIEIPKYEIKEFVELVKEEHNLKENLNRLQKENHFDLGALCIVHKNWMMLYDTILYHNDKAVLEIDFPYTCATFNYDASKLFLINSLAIVIIETMDFTYKKEAKYSFIKLSEKS